MELTLLLLAAAAVLVTIIATLRPIGLADHNASYVADFTSASHLKVGETVRVAGVEVGQVTGIDLTAQDLAEVHFRVSSEVPVSSTTKVAIRYLDLAGNRYLALDRGATDGTPQGSATIPVARTTPALDINDLLNGFRPLLRGLNGADLNALSLEIVQTLQGDGNGFGNLMAHTASLTQGLAARSNLISEVIGNLNGSIGLFADRHIQLEGLIASLSSLSGGLAADRVSITESISHIDDMTALTASLLSEARPSIKADVAQLGAIATTLSSQYGHDQIAYALNELPGKLARLSSTASYGSWFNYYICGVRIVTSASARGIDPVLAHLLEQIHLVDSAARCR
ncbi:ABC transporter substrate-binding protein [Nocardioides baekrokdamisoli]|uniref:ABC transporter substrate-binding protein n=1 Tax=Nocardioides baekrokdamisoli TaxID=1804624 RepID=A0A3G9II90_9ACTN|nr:ABC transporter substrate-binding protein [Nocardioides baekrokdamisoli]